MNKWSKKKRIRITVFASVMILGVAIVGGTLIYLTAKALNITKGGSIKKQVLDQAMNDPNLTTAYLNALTQKTCSNSLLGYQLIYDQPLKELLGSKNEECTRFEVTGRMNQAANIYISKQKEAKERIVTQIVASLTGVQTDSLPHDQYQVTGIWGERDGLPYQVYVLAETYEETFLVEYYPADSIGLPAVKEMVKNFKALESIDQDRK